MTPLKAGLSHAAWHNVLVLMRTIFGVSLAALLMTATAGAADESARELAANGVLRVAILVSNPVLVGKNPDGTFGGVSVDLGRLIAAKLGAQYKEVTYQTTETFAKTFGSGEWDIAI